jgi:hypothetical protein
MLTIRPPILYVPHIDLHDKGDTKQIRVKLPDGTNFQMSAFDQGNNKEYLVHIIAVNCLLEQKGTVQDVEKAFEAVFEERKQFNLTSRLPKMSRQKLRKMSKRRSSL